MNNIPLIYVITTRLHAVSHKTFFFLLDFGTVLTSIFSLNFWVKGGTRMGIWREFFFNCRWYKRGKLLRSGIFALQPGTIDNSHHMLHIKTHFQCSFTFSITKVLMTIPSSTTWTNSHCTCTGMLSSNY
jgi:hypothetical protein